MGVLNNHHSLAPSESFVFAGETVILAGATAGDMEEVTLTAAPIGNISEGAAVTPAILVVDQAPVYLPAMIKP